MKINIDVLKEAMNNTFTKRDSVDYLNDYKQIIDSIIDNERMKNLWLTYSQKYNYAKNIKFNEILNTLKIFLEELDIITITV